MEREERDDAGERGGRERPAPEQRGRGDEQQQHQRERGADAPTAISMLD